MRPLLATLGIVVFVLPLCLTGRVEAADTIVVTEVPGAAALGNGTEPGAAGCGCRDVQRPPWHGNVQGPACGPVCRGGCGGVFHANPCGQLHLRAHALAHCMTLPPCFPRLHGWLAEGRMPTPPPPALPRCHQCGAVIEGGF
jgi:hypothetical protein